MRKFLFGILLTVSIFCIGFCGGCRKNYDNVNSNLLSLDSLIANADNYLYSQLNKIADLKYKERHSISADDRYFYNNLLFENYYLINADSALVYADKCLESALATGNQDWVTHSIINKAGILAASGLMKQALDVMHEINSSDLSDNQLVDYYGQMIYIYSHLGNYTGGRFNDYYVIERLYKDSIMSVIKPEHPDYLWYKGWDVLGTDSNVDSVIMAYKMHVDSSALATRDDAKDAYLLARLYEQKGDFKNYEKYMALSAMIDVKIANFEIASLEDLATYIFNNGEGDVDRAYTFINYSLDKALNYPNRTRAFGISKTLEKINKAYQLKIETQRRHTILFLILVCVLALILIVAVIAIVWQNKKLYHHRKELDNTVDQLNMKVNALSDAEGKLNRMNRLLTELNFDLKKKNEELYEANYVKEEYIGYVFNLCSRYISKVEDLKRNIYLKLLKKQYKEIEKEISGKDMKDDLKEFYSSFDSIFLNIYPNFVNDFNSLLNPEKQIKLKEGELMNMELRIYALVRLGINDSVKIADFLHCAPQTVYNYRLRTRTRSLYDKEDFLARVKSLGSFSSH